MIREISDNATLIISIRILAIFSPPTRSVIFIGNINSRRFHLALDIEFHDILSSEWKEVIPAFRQILILTYY